MKKLLLVLLFFNCFDVFGPIVDDGKGSIGGNGYAVRYFEEKDVEKAPYKGFMAFGRTSEYWKNVNKIHLPGTVAYHRFGWNELELKEGVYRWDRLDASINSWKSQGRRFAFRIMTTNSYVYFTTPKWVFDSGAAGQEYIYSNPVTGVEQKFIIPMWSDSLFLYYHNRFIAALAQRYDGNDDIEFVDIGSYGIWGEGYSPIPASYEVRHQIFDMYHNNFKNTQLISLSLDQNAFEYNVSKGTGYRRDGVGYIFDYKQWFSESYGNKELRVNAWKTVPGISEWYTSYNNLVSLAKADFDTGVEFIYNTHMTYNLDNLGPINDSSVIETLLKLGHDIGYRFVLNSIMHQGITYTGYDDSLKMVWVNTGIAPIYKDLDLNIYFKSKTKENSCSVVFPKIMPNDTVNISVQIPLLEPEVYNIELSLKEKRHGTSIPISIDCPNMNGLYRVSNIVVLNK